MWLKKAHFEVARVEIVGSCVPIIKNWDGLFKEIGDIQALLASIAGSAFFKPFADRGGTYESKLSYLYECLTLLNEVQRKWLYLEPIFRRGSLQHEQIQFMRFVDAPYRSVVTKIEFNPSLLEMLDTSVHPNLVEILSSMVNRLDRCQKALMEYLEEKRSLMSRLYFVRDDELLEMIGQGSNVDAVQTYLKKIFQAISVINLDERKQSVVSVESEAGEVVPLQKVSVIARLRVRLYVHGPDALSRVYV